MNLAADRAAPLLARWTAALATVVAVHIAAYTALQAVVQAVPPPSQEPIMMDLAPAPVSPPPAPIPLPQADSEPEPPPPPEAKPEVVLPEPPPLPPPPERKIERPVKRDTPRPAPTRSAEVAPADAPVPAAPVVTPQQLSWQSKLTTYLARFKRYPVSAQSRNEQGTVTMRLVVERTGKILSAGIVRGSGFDNLDEAARQWVARAAPVPPFTDDMAQPSIEVTVPFRFSLH